MFPISFLNFSVLFPAAEAAAELARRVKTVAAEPEVLLLGRERNKVGLPAWLGTAECRCTNTSSPVPVRKGRSRSGLSLAIQPQASIPKTMRAGERQ